MVYFMRFSRDTLNLVEVFLKQRRKTVDYFERRGKRSGFSGVGTCIADI